MTEDAFNMGATYYVMKPFDNNMLIDRIKYIGGIINIKPVNIKNRLTTVFLITNISLRMRLQE